MNPKISIILPVYNAEKYLADTLDSILSQSFTDFEVVAVNDGSTAGSLKLLEVYAARDCRIKITDKENTGVSDTRNTAIRAANGEFIAFIDADDVYAPNYLKRMCGAIEDSGADVAVCSYLTFRHHAPTFERGGHSAPKPTTISELLDTGLMTPLWAKLIRKSVITKNKIAFDPTLSYGEDLFFSWKACIASASTVRLSDRLYGYRMTSGGATSRYHENLYEKYKAAYTDLKSFATKHGTDESGIREIDIHFVKRLTTLSFMCARAKGKRKEKIENMSRILDDDVIVNICENHFDELVKGENKKIASLYCAAKEKDAERVYKYGAKLELRLKLSRLKRRIGERRRDKR
jgi:glycosyltransferase EpsH